MTNVNLRNVGRSARRVALWFEWVSCFVDHLRIRESFKRMHYHHGSLGFSVHFSPLLVSLAAFPALTHLPLCARHIQLQNHCYVPGSYPNCFLYSEYPSYPLSSPISAASAVPPG